MDLDTLLNSYNKIYEEIHSVFGYKEDWRIIPLNDCRKNYWFLTGDKEKHGSVVYSTEPLTISSVSLGKTIYSATIYTQRFLSQWVYRTKTHTMVCADTHCDDNKFLMIFDNLLECTDPELIKIYEEKWGL